MCTRSWRSSPGCAPNLDEERRGLTTRWAERQRRIDDLAEQLALVYGCLKSIGAKMPMVDSLGLSAPHAASATPTHTASTDADDSRPDDADCA